MESEQKSQAFLRKRKMLMVLPLLVIPFLTMAFWALGGGGLKKGETDPSPGLNLRLPFPELKENSPANKLSFYEKADKDSMNLEKLMKNDPYYKAYMRKENDASLNELEGLRANTASKFTQPLNTSPYEKKDNPEQQLIERLSQLQREVNNAEKMTIRKKEEHRVSDKGGDRSLQLNKLQHMMEAMSSATAENGEIKQLDSTLEKILDIQHPERVKERIKEKSLQKKTQVFAVNGVQHGAPVTYLGSNRAGKSAASIAPKQNGFFGAGSDRLKGNEANAISAVIHQTQTIRAGATVKLRLLTDVYVNGNLISKGSFVFGTASLQNERLLVTITGIRHQNNLLPVSLTAYDIDGLAGIYVPGSISRDVGKQSVDQSLQGIGLLSFNPSLKAQAAAAGVQAAKGLLSKKIKSAKVTVEAGYRVLLKDGNTQEN